MVFPPFRARSAVAATFLVLLTSCGAGIVAAVVGSDSGSGGNPTASTPSLTAPQPVGPLVPESGSPPFRRVIISDVVLPPSFTVELRWMDATSPQPALILSDPTPQTTVVGFFMQTSEIVTRLAADSIKPWEMDVRAQLAVLADGVEVAPPVPFLLLRQLTVALVPPAPGASVYLSPLGGPPRLNVRIGGLRADAKKDDLAMLLVTLDPADAQQFLSLECTDLRIEPIPGSADVRVSGIAPSNTFPGEVLARVTDTLAGSSPFVGGVYYGPDVLQEGSTSPGAGPTDGGTLVSLFGTAMVPLDFPAAGKATLAFDRASIVLRKGGRELTLPATDLRREESSLNRLVFPMPPSPDGRPGPVGVVLKVAIGAPTPPEDQGVFFYGDSSLDFGPRGAVLSQASIAMETVSVQNPSTEAPDAALLTDVGGVPVVQLYGSAENGMFHRFGLPVQAGLIDDPAQHVPVDLAAGNFDTGSVEDLMVINAGLGTLAGHDLIIGRGSPSSPPLQSAGSVLTTNGQTRLSASGDLDGDGAGDLVLLPGPQAAIGAPEIFLASPARPGFDSLGHPPVGDGPFEAVDLDDLDGDGILDLILATGGLDPEIVIAYGVGDGRFEDAQTLDLQQAIPGYAADAQSAAVGVHGCGGTPKSIAVVFAGIPGSGVTEPTVAVLAPSGRRNHTLPVGSGVVTLGGADTPLGLSLAADLDGDGMRELILAASGDSAEPLRLLVWGNQGFSQEPGGVDAGLERPVHITAMDVEVVVPGANPRLGLLLSHRVQVDGFEEHRLSTRLVAPGPRLLAADSSLALDVPIGGVVSGDFSGSPSPRRQDLALACQGGPAGGAVVILANDGLGTMSELGRTDAPGILPKTLTRRALDQSVFADDPHGLAWLRNNAMLEVLVPVPGEGRMREVTYDLITSLPAHLQGLPVSGDSAMAAAEVNGDGQEDLVVLLRFDGLLDPGEGDAVLVVVRGRAPVDAADPPLMDPGIGTVTHGLASSMALGNLVLEAGGARRLELAMAVPVGSAADPLSGNHVRFYRYDPAADAFVRSFSGAKQALLAGLGPERLVSADFSGNGVDDILVCSDDGHMRLFVNRGIQVPGMEREVNVDAFTAGSVPRILPPGGPARMVVSDLNGDLVADVLVATSQTSPAREFSVAYYLRNALGDFDGPFLLPMSRTGNHVEVSGSTVPHDARMALQVTDLNGDNRPDLAFGWDAAGTGDLNLRVLFGGSR